MVFKGKIAIYFKTITGFQIKENIHLFILQNMKRNDFNVINLINDSNITQYDILGL